MVRYIIGGIIVIGIGAAAIFGLTYNPLPVEMTEVTQRTVREFIAEDAKTRLDDEFLIAMPISGTLLPPFVEIGDEVDEGFCVAQVDEFPLEQQIKSSEALLAQVEAQIEGVDVQKPKEEDLMTSAVRVKEAQDNLAIVKKEREIAQTNYNEAVKELNRLQRLYDEGAVSESQLDEAKRVHANLKDTVARLDLTIGATEKVVRVAELSADRLEGSVDDNEFMRDSYHADIDRIKAQLDTLRTDLKKAQIKSPVDGIVLEKYVDDERVMMAGAPIMKIGDMDSIEIECDILSEEVVGIEVGDPVEITGKALNDEIAHGTVKRIYPSGFMKISALGIEQQRVRTIIELDEDAPRLRPGTSVDVRVITKESPDTLAVPERAVFRHEGGWAVFTVKRSRARLTPVELGVKNDDWARNPQRPRTRPTNRRRTQKRTRRRHPRRGVVTKREGAKLQRAKHVYHENTARDLTHNVIPAKAGIQNPLRKPSILLIRSNYVAPVCYRRSNAKSPTQSRHSERNVRNLTSPTQRPQLIVNRPVN
jgi:HlyD family secretion protein